MDSLDELIPFILEIDKEKNIFRQTHLTDHGRRENDAEHAWHMAVMTLLLCDYSNEPIDVGRTVALCLCHDLVEIYAGDTYAYDDAGKKTQNEREEKAEEKLFQLLPPEKRDYFHGLYLEFEENITPESKFAHTMDNFQPLLLNHSNGGNDWKEHGVSYNKVMGRQGRSIEGSKIIFNKIKEIMDSHALSGELIDDRNSNGEID